ncbi:hypothetical protein MKX42_30345 [Paenibacillus sp. FSL R7-0204]|uniref:hypothetical protein n=1 Tax=Paenibacillus sp. FSL R7-0204 TaxID=2921675 RepID=UPI0030F621B1
MKRLIGVSLLILLTACSNPQESNPTKKDITFTEIKSSLSNAAPILKWNDQIYLITDEKVSASEVELEIGKVTSYSITSEETTPNNFSNYYDTGTPFFIIKEKDELKELAIQTSKDTFVKAIIPLAITSSNSDFRL